MASYIFGVRNNAHILDLQQTVPMLHRALEAVRDIVAGGGRVLFVGTKRQAAEPIAEAAKRCGQFYVNHRWLGGMLTNWKTISVSIRRLHALDVEPEEEPSGLTKKEMLRLARKRAKLERSLGGIKDMGGLPDVLFVIDTNREAIAIAEANKLGIPVVAVIDSNSDPDSITYPIPGNDDAIRAVNLYCKVVSDAVLEGIQEEVIASGVDIGAGKDAPHEVLPEDDSGKASSGDADAVAAAASKDEPAAAAAKDEPAAADAKDEPAAASGVSEEAPSTDEATADKPSTEDDASSAEAEIPADGKAAPSEAAPPSDEAGAGG